MANQYTDTDIPKFLDEWYSELVQNPKSIFKIALTSEILSEIFTNNSTLSKNKMQIISYRNSRNFWWSFKKSFWFLLWFIKWIFFLKIIKRRKILITAIGSNLNSNQEYFEHLSQLGKQNDCLIVLMNLVESFDILKNDKLFYYPRFLYRKKSVSVNVVESKILAEIINDIKKVTEKTNLTLTLNKDRLRKSLKYLIHDYNSFIFLTDGITATEKIVGLIQDYDYTYNKFLYCNTSKSKSIKTVSLDTSLTLYRQFYKKVFSDFHLVWGEYKREHVLDNNEINPSNIIITGKPKSLKLKKTKKIVIKNLWLYIAQSYSDPSMFVSGRDLLNLKINLNKLSAYQKENYPDDEFELKIHPADNPLDFSRGIKKTVNTPINDLLARAKIIFVEDTTLAVELISEDYTLIYVLDKYGKDNIGLVEQGLMPGINISESSDNVIDDVLNKKSPMDLIKREKVLHYYFGNYERTNFYMTLNKIFFPDETH